MKMEEQKFDSKEKENLNKRERDRKEIKINILKGKRKENK